MKKRSKLRTAIPALFAICLIALVRVFAFSFIPPEDHNQDWILFLSIYYLIVTILILFVFNYVLIKVLNVILSWKKYPVVRFILQMILGTLFSLVAINLVYHSVKFEFTDSPPNTAQMLLMNIYASSILLPLQALYFGFKFLKAWRKSELEAEQLQKENTRSQLMTLRNHLDPHFLFNNLNILSSLMDKDVEQSKSYLDKFAEVYRQILKTEYSDLTTLREEMKLIDSYVYLLKTRFEDQVFYDFKIDELSLDKALPPLTIQMLIENAIKHNLATKENPITIQIIIEGNRLKIQNNMQKKKYLEREREASGLNNIKKRYAFFTEEDVEIIETNESFIVSVPLLDIDYD